MPSKFRYLRIAFSALCGTICLLLITWWMWSYRYIISVALPLSASRTANVDMQFGRAYLYRLEVRRPQWHMKSRKMNSPTRKSIANMREREVAWGFGAYQDLGFWVIIVPHWFLVALFAFLATIPWFRLSRRFSLRALLLAMTLLAAVLGAFSYFGSKPALPPLDVGDFTTGED